MAISWRYAARTDVGLVRSRNEDSAYAGPQLLVLADGMGGHAAGNVASSVAVGELVALDGEAHGAGEAMGLVGSAVGRANSALRAAVRDDSRLRGMGTTITALLRSGNKLVLTHIGDSRAYLLREGELTQITSDHSYVQNLVDEGRLSEQDALHHPQRSLVTRVLTGSRGDEPDLSLRETRVGDRYLLCSDGLSDYVARDTIAEVLQAGADVDTTADRLVALALKAGAPDNVTVIVADVVDPDDSPATTPQVVGAAAERQAATTLAMPQSPAAKAAALSRQAGGEPDAGGDQGDAELERLTLAEETASRRLRWLRRGGLLLVLLLVLSGGGYAAYAWSQQQFFVGEDSGTVAVYRGVAQDIGPLRLWHLDQSTDVPLADLPEFYRTKVHARIDATGATDAQRIVGELRTQATDCALARSTGKACTAG